MVVKTCHDLELKHTFYETFGMFLHHTFPPKCINLLIMHPATAYVILTISGLLLQEQIFTISFLPSVIRDWNELPGVVRQLDSVCAFKNYLNRDFTPVHKY